MLFDSNKELEQNIMKPIFLMRILLVAVLLGNLTFSQTRYFPDRAFDNDARMSALFAKWYSQNLHDLQEPSLYESSKSSTNVEVYRLTLLPAFTNPRAYRLEIRKDGTGVLFVKEVANKDSGKKPIIQVSKQLEINAPAIKTFLKLVSSNSYWTLPTEQESHNGRDGTQWILEGMRGGKYHVVERWSWPLGPVHAIGKAIMVDLARESGVDQ